MPERFTEVVEGRLGYSASVHNRMARQPRGLVANRLIEVTTRTIQGRFFLRPSRETTAILKGVIARAQTHVDMTIVAAVAMSNHVHFLLVPRSLEQLAEFMRYFKSNTAIKLNPKVGWEGTFWASRYGSRIVSDEEDAQLDRLLYILRHGVKENLVARSVEWPGLNVVHELANGYEEVIGGVWDVDQTSSDSAPLLSFFLSPLPCWRNLAGRERSERIRAHLESIEKAGRRQRAREGKKPLGVKKILSQDPQHRPSELESTSVSRFHTSSREALEALRAEWRNFLSLYRTATEALKRGEEAHFPPGCFPPGLPFVPESLPP